MFSIKHNECVGFESRWKVKKVSANSNSQTTEFSVADQASSTSSMQMQEVQTDSEETSAQPEVDMDKLAKWLDSIYPKVKEQIDNANNSRAFKNYRLLDGPVDSTCQLVNNINIASKTEDSKAIPIVACLQWNNTGKILAVVHNFKHKTWCHHTGAVSIYPLARDNSLPDTPKKRFSTESCITMVKFHPLHSTVLAASTFTGSIYIWNTENDVDPLLANVVAHDEYITQLSWVSDVNTSKGVCLVTSSTDGLMKMWNFDLTDYILQLKIIFKIKLPVFGMINQFTNVSQDLIEKEDLGIVCFDFSKHTPDIFIVALEGGLVTRCSTLGMTKIKGNSNDTCCYDPVYKYYEPHQGEVNAIRFAPHRNDMFVTNGTDGEIRIYLLDQDDPSQIIFTKGVLNDISFILYEEKLLAGCGQNGTLEVFHLVTGKSVGLTFDTKITKRTLISIAVNNYKTNLAVVGNNNGEIQLWDMPWQNIEHQARK